MEVPINQETKIRNIEEAERLRVSHMKKLLNIEEENINQKPKYMGNKNRSKEFNFMINKRQRH